MRKLELASCLAVAFVACASLARGENACADPPGPGLLILATDTAFADSANLPEFILHKQDMGYRVFTQSVESAVATYPRDAHPELYDHSGPPDRADGIRAFLRATRATWDYRYVLLIGNPDPYDPTLPAHPAGDVPMKMVFPLGLRPGEENRWHVPTDAYYADLDTDWDLNDNGLFAEWNGDRGAGGVSLAQGELAVGRIPVYGVADVADLDKILAKTIAYETEGRAELPLWRRRAFLPNPIDWSDANGAEGNLSPIALAESLRTNLFLPNGIQATRLYEDDYDYDPWHYGPSELVPSHRAFVCISTNMRHARNETSASPENYSGAELTDGSWQSRLETDFQPGDWLQFRHVPAERRCVPAQIRLYAPAPNAFPASFVVALDDSADFSGGIYPAATVVVETNAAQNARYDAGSGLYVLNYVHTNGTLARAGARSYWRLTYAGAVPQPVILSEFKAYVREHRNIKSLVLPTWTENGFGIVASTSHGMTGGLLDVIESGECPQLRDDRPALVFLNACLVASPENRGNLLRSLLVNGAIAAIGATRESFGYGGQGYASFFRHAVGNAAFGDALRLSAQAAENDGLMGGNNMFSDVMRFNLYGDPTVSLDFAAPEKEGLRVDGQREPAVATREVELSFADGIGMDPGAQMRIGDSLAGLAESAWQPFASVVSWTLKDQTGTQELFAQVRSGAKGPSRLFGAVAHLLPTQAVQVCADRFAAAFRPDDTGAGTNWSTAKKTIQAAIDAAQPGQVVAVLDGVYESGGRAVHGSMANRVALDKPIVVRSVSGPEATVIRGQGGSDDDFADPVRCAYVGTNAVLEGFTLTGGATRPGGDTWKERSGGGAWCETSGTLSNCVVAGNRATRCGGGVAGGRMDRCTLENNRAEFGGGGAAGGRLANCLVNGNEAREAGEDGGGGLLDCVARNCTVVGNVSAGNGGGAVFGELYNSIVYGNSGENDDNHRSCSMAYCCTWPLPEAEPGAAGNGGNLAATGQIFAAGYRLSIDSPCVDAGSNRHAQGALDRDGRPRIVDGNGDGMGRVDLGAFELTARSAQTIRFRNPGDQVVTNVIHLQARASSGLPVGFAVRSGPARISKESDLTFGRTGEVILAVTQAGDEAWLPAPTLLATFKVDPVPAVHIANKDASVGHETTCFALRGSNTVNVASIRWTNETTGSGAAFRPHAVAWRHAEVCGLALGRNAIVVKGYGRGGDCVAQDRTWIVRRGPSVLYVSPTGCETYPFATPNGAARSIQSAIDAAGQGGQTNVEIVVLPGTYALVQPARLDGSLRAAITLRGEGEVVLDGQNRTRCLEVRPGPAGAGVENLVVVNGNAGTGDGGGAIVGPNGTMRNCVVSNCAARNGGGAYLEQGGTVAGCEFVANTASGHGGAVYLAQSGLVDRCWIENNAARLQGGGAMLFGGGWLRSSLLVGNAATYGGGTYFYKGGRAENCTWLENAATRGGGGFHGVAGTDETACGWIVNGVVHGNQAEEGAGSMRMRTSCCLQLPREWDAGGNVITNPAMDRDGRPRIHSPCLDSGTHAPWMTNALDLVGSPRVCGKVDMGAYEADSK